MKNLFVIVFLLLSSPILATGQDPIEATLDKLIGRVHSVRAETLKFSFTSSKRKEGKRYLSSIEEYDAQAKLTKSISYKPDGSIEFDWTPPANPNEQKAFMGESNSDEVTELRIKAEYDEKGNIAKESTYTLEGELLAWTLYKYDAAGNRIEESEFHKGELMRRDTHTYDQNGKKISTSRYDSLIDSGDNPDMKWEYQYDSKNNLLAVNAYDSDGSTLSKTRYEYDSAGSVTEEVHYESGGSLSHRTIYVYKYDSKGNWIRRTTYRVTMISPKETDQAELPERNVTEILYRTIIYY